MQGESLATFLDQLASSAPTPGGGSVAALCGALSAALSSMVANLTLGREKYRDVEPEVRLALERAEQLRSRFLELIDEDITAYGALSAAYRLPKSTAEEQATRSSQIQAALTGAAEAPLRMVEQARQALELCQTLASIGNPNVISDVGVAAITAYATLESGELNVLINLKTMKDKELARGFFQRLSAAQEDANTMRRDILRAVRQKMDVGGI
jgi:formiminotetrahydrofolate cyclodeaminase